jgi:prolyl oligopeptidase
MRRVLLVSVLAACGSSSPAPKDPGKGSAGTDDKPVTFAPRPPVAPRRPVTDTYFDVAVEDPYQWLEAEDDEVHAWSDGQDKYARSVLDAMPDLDAIREELRAIIAAPETRYGGFQEAGGKLFAFRKDPAKEQGELVVMTSPDDAAAATLVLDPVATFGAAATIDWFVPSPDGTKLAVSVSSGGSEVGDVHLIGLDGADLEPPIPGVNGPTGGGSLAWSPNGKKVFYTHYPRAGEAHADEPSLWLSVWSHELGGTTDHPELVDGLPRIAEIHLESDPRGRVLASVADGDGGRFRHFLWENAKLGFRPIDDFDDAIVFAAFGPTADLWLVSRKGAPKGKILKLAAKGKLARAKTIVPEGESSIVTDFAGNVGVVVTKDRLWAVYQIGGPSELRGFTLTGKAAKGPALPPVSSVGAPVTWGKDLLVWSSSFITPPGWSRFSPATGALAAIAAISPPAPVNLSGLEVRRELATSEDGTQVPLSIVWPKDAAIDGSVPCLVYGYGGYGISQEPYFVAWLAPLLKRGMCFVSVNTRGGGEFGEAWHQDGMLTKKQHVFDDFAAALRYLADKHYSAPEHLGILGGSNGGLLMGATLTQHPELVHAVVSEVGIYDQLRVELTPNGQFNITEFGTVTDQAQFEAMYAYSPYHHVQDGTKYPATLMTTGANDGRVAPWNSRKMIAALQAAQAGDAPILLRTSATSGHGMGTAMSETIDQLAHVEGFLRWQLLP